MMKKRISFFKPTGKKRLCDESGFTLVEILTVLMITSILAAVAIPVMAGFVRDAREKSYIAETNLAYTALQSYLSEEHAKGTLIKNDWQIICDLVFTPVSDPNHPLAALMDGSCTPGAQIYGFGHDPKNGRVFTFTYQIGTCRIEIQPGNQVIITNEK